VGVEVLLAQHDRVPEGRAADGVQAFQPRLEHCLVAGEGDVDLVQDGIFKLVKFGKPER
jgi:hypothetical protein